MLINKLEERKKRREFSYKFRVLLGTLFLALLVTVIVVYSKVDTTMDYPLTDYRLGEVNGGIFEEDSGLVVKDIVYEDTEVSVTGSKEELLRVSKVGVEVDLHVISEYVERHRQLLAETSELETEAEEDVSEDETASEVKDEVGTEVEDDSKEEEEEEEEGKSEEVDLEEGLTTEEIPEEYLGGVGAEFTDDGYLVLDLPIKVYGYDNNVLPYTISQSTATVEILVEEVVAEDTGEDETKEEVEEVEEDTKEDKEG